MPKCSELASTVMDIARWHAQNTPDAKIEDIVATVQEVLPEVNRQRVVDAIIEASESSKKTVSEFQKQLTKLKREAARDDELRKAITELENHLQQKTLPAGTKPRKINRTEAIQELTDRRNDLQRALAKSEPAIRQRYEQSLNRAMQRLEDASYLTPEVSKDTIPESRELQKLRFKQNQVQTQIRRKIDDMRPRSIWSKGIDGLNSLKTLMATGEFSGVLRQGKTAIFADPKAGGKAIKDMFQAFSSAERNFEINQRLFADEDAALLINHGLAMTDDGGLSNNIRDDAIINTGLSDRLGFAGFNRAYETFANSLRLHAAKGLMQYSKNAEPTAEELKAITNTVNVFTGRGTLGDFENAAPFLNSVMFSPRYQMSRLQLLTGQPAWKTGSPELRKKIIARYYGGALTGMLSQYLLYALAFGQSDEFSASFNPLSSMFGKVRVEDTVIDPLAGLAQPIVLMSRAVTGKTATSKGEERAIRGEDVKFGQDDDIIARYLRTKLAPAPGAVWDFVKGQDVVGNKQTLGGKLMAFATPMTYSDIYDVMTTEQGIPAKVAQAALAMLGEGVNVYSDKGDAGLKAAGLDPKMFELDY